MADPVPPELKSFEIDPDMVDVVYGNDTYSGAIADWTSDRAARHPEVWWDLNVNNGKGDPVWDRKTFQKVSNYNLAVRAYNEAKHKGADEKELAVLKEKVASTSKTAAPELAAYAKAVMQFDGARLDQLRKRIESLKAEKKTREQANSDLTDLADRFIAPKLSKEEVTKLKRLNELLETFKKTTKGVGYLEKTDKFLQKQGIQCLTEFVKRNQDLINSCKIIKGVSESLIALNKMIEAKTDEERVDVALRFASTSGVNAVGELIKEAGKRQVAQSAATAAFEEGAVVMTAEGTGAALVAVGSSLCLGVAIGKGVVFCMTKYVEYGNQQIVNNANEEVKRNNRLLRYEIAEEALRIAWLQEDIDKLQAVVNNTASMWNPKSSYRGSNTGSSYTYTSRGYYDDFYYWRREVCKRFLDPSPRPGPAAAPAGR